MAEATAGTQTKVLYLEFAIPTNRAAHIFDLAMLFEAIDRVLADLAILAHEEGPISGYADIDIVSLEVKSPLKMVLGIARLPKNAVRAFTALCERLLFLDEERSHRAAVAASAWEDATAKRLTNIKAAIDIAQSAKAQGDVRFAGYMDRLVEDVIKLEKSDLRLKRFELDDSN
jgi:hypothetical protein